MKLLLVEPPKEIWFIMGEYLPPPYGIIQLGAYVERARAKENGWIEDDNLFNYDMAHAVMGTETLSKSEVQEELYNCYNHFYSSWSRRIRGILSANELKRSINLYMAGRGLLVQLKELI